MAENHSLNEQILNRLLVERSFRSKYGQLKFHNSLFLNGLIELTKNCANYLKIV